MFTPIDLENWPRREIYERFQNYSYTVTEQLDITRFLAAVKAGGYHFYPAICHAFTRAVNEDWDFRYGKVEGRLGTWDRVDTHYTLMRAGSDLFTHTVTQYSDDFDDFHARFERDKTLAEAGDRLYYNDYSPLDSFHLTMMPNLPFTAISFSKPASFTKAGTGNQALLPFAIIGQYRQRGEHTILPVAVEFQHAVNDGLHAGRLFEAFGRAMDGFAAGRGC